MKKLTTLTIAILASLLTFGQTTYYTSGKGTGEWNNPLTWIENAESGPVGPPTAQDHIVIKHTVTHFAEDGYTHFGNITIEKSGSYEIFSGFDPEAVYIFAGQQFKVEGSLITTADFQHQEAASTQAGVFMLQPSSLVYIGDDLILEGNGGVVVNNASCGAGSSLNDVQFRGVGTYVCGNGSFIVGADVRAWDANGNEITSANQARNQVETRVCEGFAFYASGDDCQSKEAIVEGKTDLDPGFALTEFTAQLKDGKTNIDWATQDEFFYDFFTVEKSQDGQLFEVAGDVDAEGQFTGIKTYEMKDEAPYQNITYYRLKQTMLDGTFAYSEVVAVENRALGGELHLFPNPTTASIVNVKAGNFIGKEMLTITVRNMLGQVLLTQKVQASPGGEINYKLQHKLDQGTYVLVVSGKMQQQRVSHMLQVQ